MSDVLSSIFTFLSIFPLGVRVCAFVCACAFVNLSKEEEEQQVPRERMGNRCPRTGDKGIELIDQKQ